jgi:hypothetical protein
MPIPDFRGHAGTTISGMWKLKIGIRSAETVSPLSPKGTSPLGLFLATARTLRSDLIGSSLDGDGVYSRDARYVGISVSRPFKANNNIRDSNRTGSAANVVGIAFAA